MPPICVTPCARGASRRGLPNASQETNFLSVHSEPAALGRAPGPRPLSFWLRRSYKRVAGPLLALAGAISRLPRVKKIPRLNTPIGALLHPFIPACWPWINGSAADCYADQLPPRRDGHERREP